MEIENIENILTTNTFFKGLHPRFIKSIEDSASIRRFNTHEYLFYEGNWIMEKQDLKGLIEEQPFFEDLEEEFLDILVECASDMVFDKGHFLLTEGKDADRFYIIKHGKVIIEVDADGKGPVNIQTLEAGDILGWSWLIPPYKWSFDALAVEPTSVISFDGKTLRKKCEKNYKFGYELLKRITGIITYRLMNTRKKLMDFCV
jgi:CRP/FNR family transcriptional regulator, cyclic AMP receptor protein